MSVYIGTKGKQYSVIEPALGKGGEGSVYKISGMPDYVLKVFLDNKRTETRHRKLLAMIATPLSPSAMQQVTWPIDVVYQNNQFVGYIMPLIKNNEDLNIMYSDKYICTLSEKITIARNLCAAINAVHNAGHVCGDLNPKNIGVDPQSARITLVDTDSYHITDSTGTNTYRCEVGMPEYLPREIQDKMKNGSTLATAPLPTFTKYTDLFALAVHVFALLMNGCHPYACAVNNTINIKRLSVGQPSVARPEPIENICNGFFPFYMSKKGITTPIYAPSFDMLTERIKDLFVKAFVNGHTDPTQRPDTVEWYNALTEMQQDLVICNKNDKHLYPSHLNKCPWCELENTKYPVATPPVVTPHIVTPPVNNSTFNKRTSVSTTKATTPSTYSYQNIRIQKDLSIFGKICFAVITAVCMLAPLTIAIIVMISQFSENIGASIESSIESTLPVFAQISELPNMLQIFVIWPIVFCFPALSGEFIIGPIYKAITHKDGKFFPNAGQIVSIFSVLGMVVTAMIHEGRFRFESLLVVLVFGWPLIPCWIFYNKIYD